MSTDAMDEELSAMFGDSDRYVLYFVYYCMFLVFSMQKVP